MYVDQKRRAQSRRGVILLVVIILLTLFAIVGLGFVYYSSSQADAARVYREAQIKNSPQTPDIPADDLAAEFLRQLIYDLKDIPPGTPASTQGTPADPVGTASALRGHSLGRTMYGWNDGSHNDQAYNGIGRLHSAGAVSYGSTGVSFSDDVFGINYQYFPADGFCRDPERYFPTWTARSDNTTPSARGYYTGGLNAPYTAPDLNTLCLAAVRPNDGAVILPSYHRRWLFGSYDSTANANWTNVSGKYLTLRPREYDQRDPASPSTPSAFPYPQDEGGDVKNLVGSPGTLYFDSAGNPNFANSDSYWIDIGWPVTTLPDGRKFKPLFAPLIVDLNNRINLNVHGNVHGINTMTGSTPGHASNQGWGPWEVSVQRVLNADSAGPGTWSEWTNLFTGNNPGTTGNYGRYGVDLQPGIANAIAGAGQAPHFYGQVDFDGCNEQSGYVASAQLALPVGTNCFPTYGAGYGNGFDPGAGTPPPYSERKNHPLNYNVFEPKAKLDPTSGTSPAADDLAFAVSDTQALLRDLSSSYDVTGTLLGKLCPTNFASMKIRQQATTISFDVDRAGLTPWIYTDSTTQPYKVYSGTIPTGPQLGYRDITTKTASDPKNGEYDTDWRGVNSVDSSGVGSVLSKVDLNRYLPPYPHMGSGLTPATYNPTPMKKADMTPMTYYDRFDPGDASAQSTAIVSQFQAAQTARQQLAKDLYVRLVAVTGVTPPADPANPTDQELIPLRWLGQLAANIVDFIDEDDIATPFHYYEALQEPIPSDLTKPEPPKYWVLGTELPRVVVNEVYGEYTVPAGGNGTNTYKMWAELHNPFPQTPTANPANSIQLQDQQPVALLEPTLPAGSASTAPSGAAQYGPYRILMTAAMRLNPNNDNVLGDPDWTAVRAQTADADFASALTNVDTSAQTAPSPSVAPYQPLPAATPGAGFLIAGPASPDQQTSTTAIVGTSGGGTVPDKTPWLQSGNMAYPVTWVGGTPTPDDRTGGVAVLLRRLANPHLPYEPRAQVSGSPNPWYNPFYTVDVVAGAKFNDTAAATVAGDQSQGKLQPYASDATTQIAFQGSLVATKTGNTFGQVNSPNPGNYDWLVHLDRQLVSPIELFMVSAFQPWQLTQQFIQGANKQRHLANVNTAGYGGWVAQNQRLYRLLEFVETKNRATGVAVGGRTPGQVNLNTLWEKTTTEYPVDPTAIPDTLLAVCAPDLSGSGPNNFTASDITTLYQTLRALRNPGSATPPGMPTSGPVPAGFPSEKDSPFWSMTAPYSSTCTQFPASLYPTGFGINNTILRAIPGGDETSQRLFQLTQSHPYLQNQLLNKIYNQITTRSNTFAVWLTVGFFEVTDDTTTPPRLGAEIGGTQAIRHHMFAIVDRSALTVAPTGSAAATAPGAIVPGTWPVTLSAIPTDPNISPDQSTGQPLSIRAGSIVTVRDATDSTGSTQETVPVLSVDPVAKTFTAKFYKSHAAGAGVWVPKYGNPGPQFPWRPQDNSAVVPIPPWTD